MFNHTKLSIEMKGELSQNGADEVAKIEAWGRVINSLMNRVFWIVAFFVSPEFIDVINKLN